MNVGRTAKCMHHTLLSQISVYHFSKFTIVLSGQLKYEPVHEKTNNLGPDQVLHKPGCTVTAEAGNNGADQSTL